ncbi:MAG: hypothetical protein HFE35_08030 [Clostridia bacterium]|jgi:acyl carrier protein|nr:hypothetical protein [Clostridia bacterium]
MKNASEIVTKVLKDLGVENASVTERIKEDCGLDSLSLVSVIVGLEEELGGEFDDADLDPAELITVENLITLTEKYL